MRVANLVEGLLFTAGFLVLCLVILMDRSARKAPVPQLVPVRVRKRIR